MSHLRKRSSEHERSSRSRAFLVPVRPALTSRGGPSVCSQEGVPQEVGFDGIVTCADLNAVISRKWFLCGEGQVAALSCKKGLGCSSVVPFGEKAVTALPDAASRSA